ncbi:MAG: PDZ domain-containing protein [Chitinophagales bacterium]|nr:PDZ domain-containing protein [Chitinophagales bacterium]
MTSMLRNYKVGILCAFFAVNAVSHLYAQNPKGKIIIKSYELDGDKEPKVNTQVYSFDQNLNPEMQLFLDSLLPSFNWDSGVMTMLPLSDVNVFFEEMSQPKPYLGIVFQDLKNPEATEVSSTIEVTKVMENSAAAEAGIQVGDEIKSINEVTINELSQIVQMVQEHAVGDTLNVKISRNGEEIVLTPILKARNEQNSMPQALILNGNNSRSMQGILPPFEMGLPPVQIQRPGPRLGVTIVTLDAEMKKDLHVKKQNGVLVTQVVKNSNAEIAGLKVNDVIIEVDGNPVLQPKDVKEAICCKKMGSDVTIKYLRYGKKKETVAYLNQFEENWDDTQSPNSFNFNMLPKLNLQLENGQEINVPLDLSDQLKIQEELQMLKQRLEELEKKQK